MDKALADRIALAYPTGLIHERHDEALVSAERDDRLRSALDDVARECNLVVIVEPFDKPAYQIALTQADCPSIDTWTWGMRNPDKLRWIKDHGLPYPVLWLRVSRVADYYRYFFNHWVPRGDTGYLDADFRVLPNALWRGYEEVLSARLEAAGFQHCSDSLAAEKTSLVLESDYDAIPEDDPRWDDDAYEPPLVPASVYLSLFGE
jgi:hypothetical protein